MNSRTPNYGMQFCDLQRLHKSSLTSQQQRNANQPQNQQRKCDLAAGQQMSLLTSYRLRSRYDRSGERYWRHQAKANWSRSRFIIICPTSYSNLKLQWQPALSTVGSSSVQTLVRGFATANEIAEQSLLRPSQAIFREIRHRIEGGLRSHFALGTE